MAVLTRPQNTGRTISVRCLIFSRVHATLQPALSVRRLVGWSVGWLVGWSVTLELKMRKTRIYDTAVVTLCVGVC